MGQPRYDMAFEHDDFFVATGQHKGIGSIRQLALYRKLIDEECNTEMLPALDELLEESSLNHDRIKEIIDCAADTLYVVIGLLKTLGVDANEVFKEVHSSNMTKVDPETGVVKRRDDGKILKPEGYRPPDLTGFANEAYGMIRGRLLADIAKQDAERIAKLQEKSPTNDVAVSSNLVSIVVPDNIGPVSCACAVLQKPNGQIIVISDGGIQSPQHAAHLLVEGVRITQLPEVRS